MTYISEEVLETKYRVVGFICDCCKESFTDHLDLDNIVHIKHTFGYGSEHDGKQYSFHMCEDCFMEKILKPNKLEDMY